MSTRAEPATPAPRILVVIGQLERGGTELHLVQVLPLLAREGFEIEVYAFKPEGPLAPLLETAGIPVRGPVGRPPGWRGLWHAATGLRRHVRSRAPAIVHYFLPAAYLIGSLVTWDLRSRQVMSRRGLATYHARYPGVRRIEHLLHRRLAAVLANSRAIAAELLEEGVDPARLAVIHNGVTWPVAAPSRADAREDLGLGAGTLVLVTIANLIPYKGHADLLRACALAADALSDDWCLCLVGRDDGIGSELRSLAQALGIDARVRFVGAVHDVVPWLAAADIGVLASHEEGFSNAVLEGMAAGLPMIVTAVGGNPEAVQQGTSGRLVPPRDPVAMAAALRELAASPELRAAWGHQGRQRVAREFSVAHCVARYAEVYRRVISGMLPVLLTSDMASASVADAG